jgi:hypothetical protein
MKQFMVITAIAVVLGLVILLDDEVRPQGLARTVTVGGTGILEEIPENGQARYRLVADTPVDLGVIDEQTYIRDYGAGKVLRLPDIQKFIGKRVTALAEVEVGVDDKEVFRAVRADGIMIFHKTMVRE